MRNQIFTIYDVKAKAYITPFVLPNDGMAIRTFQTCANDLNHAFGQHPEDYVLYRIGEFDSDTGELINDKSPELIIKAIETLKPRETTLDIFEKQS